MHPGYEKAGTNPVGAFTIWSMRMAADETAVPVKRVPKASTLEGAATTHLVVRTRERRIPVHFDLSSRTPTPTPTPSLTRSPEPLMI